MQKGPVQRISSFKSKYILKKGELRNNFSLKGDFVFCKTAQKIFKKC